MPVNVVMSVNKIPSSADAKLQVTKILAKLDDSQIINSFHVMRFGVCSKWSSR